MYNVPKITVCVCVFNGESYIGQTLDAICQQTYLHFKLLIIDDGSTDSTITIVREYFKGGHQINYGLLCLDQNGGIANARHLALNHIDTRYIIFIDADDKPYPKLVEKLFRKIESDEDLVAVGCYLEYIDKSGRKMHGGIFIGSKTKDEFYEKARNEKLIFMHPCAIFNREIALSVGGMSITGFPSGKPRYQDMCEDLDLWTRMSDLYIHRKAIIIIPEILCQYRKMENTVSTNTLAMKLRMKHIKENLILRRSNRKELTFVDFLERLNTRDMKKVNKEVKATDNLREFGFAVIKRNYFKAVSLFVAAFTASPKYVLKKITSNLKFRLIK